MIEEIKKLLPKIIRRKEEIRCTIKLVLEDDMLISIDEKHINYFNSLGRAKIHLENIVNYYEKD